MARNAIELSSGMSSDYAPACSTTGDTPERLNRVAPSDGVPNLLQGRRVLIVEDEFFLATLIEETLQEFGCETIGPFTRLELALQASRQEIFDIAILDINLNGKMVFPLADDLVLRGLPFVFLTGYAAKDLPEAYRALPRVQKPFDSAAVRQALEQVLAGTTN